VHARRAYAPAHVDAGGEGGVTAPLPAALGALSERGRGGGSGGAGLSPSDYVAGTGSGAVTGSTVQSGCPGMGGVVSS
jgi:hypothetical protein